MAGDIGVEEQVIVLSPTAHEAARAPQDDARGQGARIFHRYGPRVLIGDVPRERTGAVRAAYSDADVAAAPQDIASAAADDLDPIGAYGLAAFQLRQSPEFIRAKEQRPNANAQWDQEGLLPPDPPPQHQALTRAPVPPDGEGAQAAVGNTSQQMTGSIAVGIIIVSGPTPDLQFSVAETQKVIAEVQNGLGWQAAQNPAANITWTYDIHSVQVNAAPGSSPDKEGLWRNPAMQQLGYTPDWQGVVDYVEHIRTQYGTEWTFVGYFTKYPLDWFAYANIGGPRLVMQYDNDGWGPDNIDRVFAHETGHVFQAPDEYASSACDCGGSWGIYNKPNGNCQLCAPGGGVECIMRSNSWAYCAWTPYHYGFPIVQVTGSLGAIAIENHARPYTFVQASDGNMWVNWWTGSEWKWSLQGTPPGVAIDSSMGTITVDDGRPYAFVQGSDGNLWINWWSGSAWAWSNQGRPPDVNITRSMGAITVDGGRPYVFVQGSDGNLWVNWWSGSAWSWANQGLPGGVTIDEPAGAIAVDGGRPYVFVRMSDGNLWVNWWSGSAWSWANQGKPPGVNIGDSLGTIVVDGGRPYAFCKGSDGNLWVNWWSGSAWAWSSLGTPPSASIVRSMGAVTVDGGRPYVFVTGSDGNLWVNWWSGSAWSWSNQSRPAGVTLGAAMGVMAVDHSRPYLFAGGDDGNLWVNWWSGSAWSWTNQKSPSP
jgi:hypothetical protein